MTRNAFRNSFLTSTLLCGAALGAFAAPAFAQTQSATGGQAQSQSTTVQEVVVTGSILSKKLSATSNPVTVVSAQELNDRDITTMADAVQTLSSNGAGTLPNSFTANGAFAAGASAASLRGLTTNSTLTLIDGLRTAYYPLADDGVRNFVDMNSIPDIIVDRIETEKDGGSSTYGADAIAGVINIVTKKQYQGLTMRAEGGFTQHGGGNTNNYQLLVGHGDLQKDGYNVYLGMEYEHDDALYNRQRGYPYDTSNLSNWCGTSLQPGIANTVGSLTCRANGVANGLQFNNTFLGIGATNVATVVPVNAAGAAIGNAQILGSGCGKLTPVTITPTEAGWTPGNTGIPGFQNGPVNLCQQDNRHDYNEISPDDKRFSVSFRATKELGGGAEAYVSGTFYQNDVLSRGTPQSVQQVSTPGPLGLLPYSSVGITLPALLANGQLNPNNPFAAQGQAAELFYQFGDMPTTVEQLSQTFRLSAGVKGSFDLLGPWKYNVEFAASQDDLTETYNGDIQIAHLLNAISTGSYNFVNPALNTAAERNYLAPTDVMTAKSQLGMLQGTLTRDLMELPGGEMQLGLVGMVRFESIYDPTANTDANGQLNRYFSVNPFGVIGQRWVQAGAFELDAPILHGLDIDLGGRFDNYSTGQQAFSPKLAAKYSPIKQITFRGTASEGFRIPSFAESDSLPTTGYITTSAPKSFQASHNNDGYGQNYSLGEITASNPNLKPERSENFTGGIVLDPTRQLSFSLDLYYIQKKDVITANTTNLQQAIAAYYAGTPMPSGYKAIAGGVDPNLPNATPELGFIEYSYANLNKEVTSGYDIGATGRFNLPYDIRWTSYVDGNYVLYLNMITPQGVQKYAGTIGPYNDVSASGTPKFRFNWQNTFARGPFTATITTYYTDGYKLEAADFGDTPGTCISGNSSASAINSVYLDGVTPVSCKVKSFWQVDLHGSYQLTPHLQVYGNISNLFDRQAPLDPTTYGGWQYNPAWANGGVYGRTFKIGFRATY